MITEHQVPTVGVVGLGAIGYSICLALTWAGCNVVGYDHEPGRTAQVLGWRGISVAVLSLQSMVNECPDLVFVAVPPDAVIPIGQRLLDLNVVVTDVCSIKSPVVASLGKYPRFVGGHPLAGTDQVGPGAGRADLFRDASWVLTPGSGTDPDSIAAVTKAVRAMEAVPVLMDSADHDKAVAFSSHLPHVVASALSAAVGRSAHEYGCLAGPGFRDTTRVANGPAGMWRQILEGNREHVVSALEAMREELALIYQALRSCDSAAVVAQLERGAASRREILEHAPGTVTKVDVMATGSSVVA
jgi:prephenate dehydrogenase